MGHGPLLPEFRAQGFRVQALLYIPKTGNVFPEHRTLNSAFLTVSGLRSPVSGPPSSGGALEPQT